MEKLDQEEKAPLYNEVEEALAGLDMHRFRDEFLEMHPYDQSELFEELLEDERHLVYSYLSPEEMADVIEHINEDRVGEFITEMNPTYAAEVLSEVATDDAVDILNDLDKDKVASYLTIMEEEAADEIKDLLHYEEKTAGSIMTTEFVVVTTDMSVKEAMRHLRQEAPDAETIYYIYVVDQERKLVGVISLRDLIIADGQEIIQDVMSDRVVSVSVADDQAQVAQMVRDYDFLALPVVDFQHHLLGIITVDDIMDVMEEEANDDYSKLAGVDVDSADLTPVQSAKNRLPWLIILMFLGLFTASIISRFEETLDQVALLAIFLPLIAGMAGNTGTQALAVAVRGITTGDFQAQGIHKIVMRELTTGAIIGLTCGLSIWGIIYIWQGTFFLGFVVGLAIMTTLLVATVSGALVPLLMHYFKVDPAVASGPFITTINDIISVVIYFGLATAFMQFLI